MRAFLDTAVSKDEALEAIRRHAEEDRLRKGHYWHRAGKTGCGVGCTLVDFVGDPVIECGHHYLYEPLFGIPQGLAHLEDCLFESMPFEKAQTWPVEFIEAIPVGADLENVARDIVEGILAHETLHAFIEDARVDYPSVDGYRSMIDDGEAGLALSIMIDACYVGAPWKYDVRAVSSMIADLALEVLRVAPVPEPAS